MSKQHWIVVLFIALVLSSLMLFTIPQGASEASYRQAKDTGSATATATPMQLVVEARTGNLRAAPGMDAKRVGIVRRNERLTVMGVAYYGTQIWYLVQLEGNEQAWISDSIVHIAGDAELVPTINLTDFFSFTATPTRTPGKATATVTRKPPKPTRTPISTQSPTNRPNSTATPRPQTNVPPPTAISQPTNPPPPTSVIPSATHVPQPTNVPPQPTNPPAPTNVPPTNPPQPTNPPPPTSVPPTNPPPPTNVPPTNPPPPTAVPQPTNPPVPPTAVNGNT